MSKREVWNNAFTPPWRNLRLLLFALAIMDDCEQRGRVEEDTGTIKLDM